jgi:LacI family transcriptional regulator
MQYIFFVHYESAPKWRNMSLTLEAIAKLAGVSRSTVSRVINGDKRVRATTRLKVQEVIDSLNFQPNIVARSLAAGQSSIIGLVIPAGVATLFTDPYFPQLIQGISAASNAHDYSVMLWMAEPAYELRTIRQILHSGLLGGVIVSSMLIDDPIVQSLYESKKPFILVGRHPNLNVNYLDIDNISGGCEATSYLIRCGYQRIATITGPQNMIAGLDRYSGYCKALKSQGFDLISELVVEGDFTEAGGYEGMKKLLPFHPDSVFVASDIMAIGALRALRENDLCVPDDIAIMGFDNAPVALLSSPPLTTMRQSPYTMGYKALETLLEIIRNPGLKTRQIILKPELVIRMSCGLSKK